MCELVCKPDGVTTGKKIKAARDLKGLGWSSNDLGMKIAELDTEGTSAERWRDRIKSYETRGTIPDERIPLIARALEVDAAWLSSEDDEPIRWLTPPSNARITDIPRQNLLNLVPYWGTVPCGNWEKPDIEEEELVSISESIRDVRKLIAVRVAGNSMSPRFQSGELVVIRLDSTPLDGVITLARNQDRELTLKLMKRQNGEWQLHSINPEHGMAVADSWEIRGHASHREESDLGGLRA